MTARRLAVLPFVLVAAVAGCGYDPSWAPEQPAHNTAGDTT